MKLSKLFPFLILSILPAFHQASAANNISTTAPSVIDAKVNPDTFELNQSGSPTTRSQITADVKDYTGNVTDVRVRFMNVPIEVPMKHVAGTTWQTELTPDTLKQLAVNGKTMKYKANIVAMNGQGQTGVSSKPIEIEVKAPSVTGSG